MKRGPFTPALMRRAHYRVQLPGETWSGSTAVPLYYRAWEHGGAAVETGYYLLGIPECYDRKQGMFWKRSTWHVL